VEAVLEVVGLRPVVEGAAVGQQAAAAECVRPVNRPHAPTSVCRANLGTDPLLGRVTPARREVVRTLRSPVLPIGRRLTAAAA
jgi:hypothetical protein